MLKRLRSDPYGSRGAFSLCALVGALVIVRVGIVGVAPVAADECHSCTGGVDTTVVVTRGLASYFGKSLCQVFAAPDSLLTDFTIWRGAEPPPGDPTGMHLYITEVDSSGTPDPSRIVLDGPTMVLSDSSSFPRAVQFHFDPPLVLPHRGKFGAAIKEEDPYCAGGFSLQVDSTGAYPCGQLWLIHKYVNCVGLGLGAQLMAGSGLRFKVRFACAGSTPAVRSTWGSLKASYR